MTDSSDKFPEAEKKDGLSNLEGSSTKSSLAADLSLIQTGAESQDIINEWQEVNEKYKRKFLAAEEKREHDIRKFLGYASYQKYRSEKERQKLSDILPSFPHDDASRAKYILRDSYDAASQKDAKDD